MKLSRDQQNKLAELISCTECSKKLGLSLLEKSGWDTDLAAECYFNNSYADEQVEKSSVDESKLHAMFDLYADHDDGDLMIDEGIEKFCQDIEIDPFGDIVVLILSWKMNANTMCQFTRTEWINGMKEIKCFTVDEVKDNLERVRRMIDSDVEFKKFYNFSFGFAKELGQKSLGLSEAIAMWELVLLPRFPKVGKWVDFLKTSSQTHGITRDTWELLLEFMNSVKDSYDGYDENEAWPVLIDDFMEWISSNK